MTRQFRPEVIQVGTDLTALAGSYLRTVVLGDWQACQTCALPVDGYPHCPECSTHLRARLPLADRVGFLVYADKPGSQAYRTMFGYKEPRMRSQYEPVVRALLAVGLRAHFACANTIDGMIDSGWAVVPSAKGRTALASLVRGMSRNPHSEVRVSITGIAPARGLSAESWEISPRSPLPEHVMVIDDSWVTGSSAQSLAVALKQAGVGQVSILAIARVLSPEWNLNRPFIKDVLPTLPYDWTICPWTGGECPEQLGDR